MEPGYNIKQVSQWWNGRGEEMKRLFSLITAIILCLSFIATGDAYNIHRSRLGGYGTPGLIGVQSEAGFGVGVCPVDILPGKMQPLPRSYIPGSSSYGNYKYVDSSIMVFTPRYYYEITAGTNSIDIKGTDTYANEAAANTAGYAIHRAFIDGGTEQKGFFIDKYKCSKTALGAGYVASSIKNGDPISTAAAHNPIADLTACATNNHYQYINAAHARDGVAGAVNPSSIFHCSSRFQFGALDLLAFAHGQNSTSVTNCAWYHATYNYPKGCNNDALGDCDDGTISYTSNGYLNCGKTGSGTPFAKTTHNGQSCGVADLNGLVWEISLGITRDASAFYSTKESVAMKDFTPGNSGATDHWGATGLAAMMDSLTIPYITGNDGWICYGNSTNQVFSEDLTGNDWILTGLSLPKDSNGLSVAGTDQFGKDGLYRHLRDELCLGSCGYWSTNSNAGTRSVAFNQHRTVSSYNCGFRCAVYPE